MIQGTYETFAAVAREHFAGDLAGRLVVTAGLGGMGSAQPLAVAAMLGGVLLCAEADADKLERRRRDGYVDRATADVGEALSWAQAAAVGAPGAVDRGGRQRGRPARAAGARRARPRTWSPT